MHRETSAALVAHLVPATAVVEVGIGNRPAVAEALTERGVSVTATDIRPRSVPDGVSFVEDDVTDPDRSIYADAETIYALNCPPELHRPIHALARSVGARFVFTTLGGDPPTVSVDRHTLPGETLFVTKPE